MLRRAYDIDNGIYTQQYADGHPYAAIEAHEAETNAWNSMFYRYAERYERYDVYSRFKISLKEFMEYHPEDCEWMISYCEHRQKEEQQAHDEATGKAKQQTASALITDPGMVSSNLKNMLGGE